MKKNWKTIYQIPKKIWTIFLFLLGSERDEVQIRTDSTDSIFEL